MYAAVPPLTVTLGLVLSLGSFPYVEITCIFWASRVELFTRAPAFISIDPSTMTTVGSEPFATPLLTCSVPLIVKLATQYVAGVNTTTVPLLTVRLPLVFVHVPATRWPEESYCATFPVDGLLNLSVSVLHVGPQFESVCIKGGVLAVCRVTVPVT